MKKFLLLILASIATLASQSSFATGMTGTGCTFSAPWTTVRGYPVFAQGTCNISGIGLVTFGSGLNVGGSYSPGTTDLSNLQTENYGPIGFCTLTTCSGTWGSTTYTCSTINCPAFGNSALLRTGPAGPAGPVGPAGATGATGPVGSTGSVGATGSFFFSSGAISGYFDNYQSSYELPQWKLTLHLSSPGTIEGAENDVVVSGSGFYVDSSYQVNDPSDPRIVLTLKNTETGTGVACGWYDVTVPSSLVQGTMYPNANPSPFTTKFEVYGCDGYKITAPPVYMLQSPETPFVAPSASGSYLAVTYKDSTTGATYIDFYALLWLLVYISGALALFYSFYKLFKKALTGRW